MSKISLAFKLICFLLLSINSAHAFLDPDLYIEKSFMKVPSELNEKLQRKIDFNFDKVELSQMLVLLSKIGDFNIVFPKELDREVSMQIKQQSIKDTLEDIALIYNYEYEFKNNAVVFKNTKLEKKIELVPLTYLSAAKILNILKGKDYQDTKINKDPALNNILLAGNEDEIKSIKDFIKNTDKAPKQKIFLPEFLSFKQIQRFLKHNLNEKADIEAKRIEQNYILLSGKAEVVNNVYLKLEEIDRPIADQAFSIEVYAFNRSIEEQLKRLDPKYKDKGLFRVNANEVNFSSYGILNSKTLKISNDSEVIIFDTDFKFSRDILDLASVNLHFDREETFFNKNSDYVIYYMPKKDLKRNKSMKAALEISKNIDLVFVIKAISDDDFDFIMELSDSLAN